MTRGWVMSEGIKILPETREETREECIEKHAAPGRRCIPFESAAQSPLMRALHEKFEVKFLFEKEQGR